MSGSHNMEFIQQGASALQKFFGIVRVHESTTKFGGYWSMVRKVLTSGKPAMGTSGMRAFFLRKFVSAGFRSHNLPWNVLNRILSIEISFLTIKVSKTKTNRAEEKKAFDQVHFTTLVLSQTQSSRWRCHWLIDVMCSSSGWTSNEI